MEIDNIIFMTIVFIFMQMGWKMFKNYKHGE